MPPYVIRGRPTLGDSQICEQTLDVDPMLGHFLQRWPNIKPTLVGCLVLAGTTTRFADHCVVHLYLSTLSGPIFSYKLLYIVGFRLVEMAISTNPKPMIYRNLYLSCKAINYYVSPLRERWGHVASPLSGQRRTLT